MDIKPEFDKRIELVFGLLYCAYIDGIIPENYGKYFFFKSCNNNYYQNFYNMYKKYASLGLKEYIKNGGFDYYERTLQIALAMDYEYTIKDNQNIEQIKINNKSFDQKKASFLLKDFTTKANYEKFYSDNANYYNALCNKFTKALNAYVNFNSNILTDFFGYSAGEFGVKIFNFVSGSFGYINENTILSCISINAEKEISDKVVTICFHEYSHPYVNKLGVEYFKKINLDKLLADAKKHGLQECYYDKINFINEYVVRTIQVYLAAKYMESDYIAKNINYQKTIGYTYIDELVSILSAKAINENFAVFYKNKIVPYFIQLNNKL